MPDFLQMTLKNPISWKTIRVYIYMCNWNLFLMVRLVNIASMVPMAARRLSGKPLLGPMLTRINATIWRQCVKPLRPSNAIGVGGLFNINSGNGLLPDGTKPHYINIDLSSVRSIGNQLGVLLSQGILQLSITKISLKITYLKFHPSRSGVNELSVFAVLKSTAGFTT